MIGGEKSQRSARRGVFLGLGANLGDPAEQMLAALRALTDNDGADELTSVHVVRCSSLWRTTPVGQRDQPDFLNAVVELETGLTPMALLQLQHEVERGLGRDRAVEERWGPRTVDLDLLLYGSLRLEMASLLTVPHPRIAERRFVLEPLAELDGDATPIVEPRSGRRVTQLLDDLRASDPGRWQADACELVGPLEF